LIARGVDHRRWARSPSAAGSAVYPLLPDNVHGAVSCDSHLRDPFGPPRCTPLCHARLIYRRVLGAICAYRGIPDQSSSSCAAERGLIATRWRRRAQLLDTGTIEGAGTPTSQFGEFTMVPSSTLPRFGAHRGRSGTVRHVMQISRGRCPLTPAAGDGRVHLHDYGKAAPAGRKGGSLNRWSKAGPPARGRRLAARRRLLRIGAFGVRIQ